jgi:hypothetical protein
MLARLLLDTSRNALLQSAATVYLSENKKDSVISGFRHERVHA